MPSIVGHLTGKSNGAADGQVLSFLARLLRTFRAATEGGSGASATSRGRWKAGEAASGGDRPGAQAPPRLRSTAFPTRRAVSSRIAWAVPAPPPYAIVRRRRIPARHSPESGQWPPLQNAGSRSEERRVGKECRS